MSSHFPQYDFSSRPESRRSSPSSSSSSSWDADPVGADVAQLAALVRKVRPEAAVRGGELRPFGRDSGVVFPILTGTSESVC